MVGWRRLYSAISDTTEESGWRGKETQQERKRGWKGVEKREEDRYTCSQRKLFVTREHTQYSNAATVQEAIHSQVVMTVKMN